MPWVRIDENAMDHPKIGGLSDGAFRLWVQGLAYCQKYLTDGAINATALRGLRAYSPKRRSELVTVTLWNEAEGGGVQVHDFLQWNESREHVLMARQMARERMQKARNRRRSPEQTPNIRVDDVPEHARNLPRGVACVDSLPASSSISREGDSKGGTIRRFAPGPLAGSLPRDHLNCHGGGAQCERVCVSERQHAYFRNKYGGTAESADRALDVFYAEVRANLDPNVPIGDSPWKFWDAQFAARFGTVAGVGNPKTAGNMAAAARFVARGQQ